jgi:hypothetical protein
VQDPKTQKYDYKKIIGSGIVTFQPSYFGENRPNKTIIKEKYQHPKFSLIKTDNVTNAYFFLMILSLLTLFVFILIILHSPTSDKK